MVHPEAEELGTSSAQAEMEKLQKQMREMHKLPRAEQEKLMARMEQLSQQMMKEMQSKIEKMQQAEQKKREFGCSEIHFRMAAGGSAQGHLSCQDERGMGKSVNFKGTMKFVGP